MGQKGFSSLNLQRDDHANRRSTSCCVVWSGYEHAARLDGSNLIVVLVRQEQPSETKVHGRVACRFGATFPLNVDSQTNRKRKAEGTRKKGEGWREDLYLFSRDVQLLI